MVRTTFLLDSIMPIWKEVKTEEGQRQCATVQVRYWLLTLVTTYRKEPMKG